MEIFIQKVGIISSVALPFFNIPLIYKIAKRKSSKDFSLSWAIGVWVCILLMTPQAMRSEDAAFKAFGVVNLFFFSIVVFMILKYRENEGA